MTCGTLTGYRAHHNKKEPRCRPCLDAFNEYRAKLRSKSSRDVPSPPPVYADTSWKVDAACIGVDTELFFLDQGVSADEARKICARCPVQKECLDYAVATFQGFGVWGGTIPKERQTIRNPL